MSRKSVDFLAFRQKERFQQEDRFSQWKRGQTGCRPNVRQLCAQDGQTVAADVPRFRAHVLEVFRAAGNAEGICRSD